MDILGHERADDHLRGCTVTDLDEDQEGGDRKPAMLSSLTAQNGGKVAAVHPSQERRRTAPCTLSRALERYKLVSADHCSIRTLIIGYEHHPIRRPLANRIGFRQGSH
jgi:hypothetical protein